MGVLQGVVDVLQHDILNEHMSGVRLVHSAGEVVLQSRHQSVQRPLAIDRHNLLPHLRIAYILRNLGWLTKDAAAVAPVRTASSSFPNSVGMTHARLSGMWWSCCTPCVNAQKRPALILMGCHMKHDVMACSIAQVHARTAQCRDMVMHGRQAKPAGQEGKDSAPPYHSISVLRTQQLIHIRKTYLICGCMQ